MSKIYSELTTKRALEDIIQSLGNCLLMTSSSRRSNQWKLWSSTEFVVQILADIGAQSSLSSLYDLHDIFKLYLAEKRINRLSKFVTIDTADGFELKLPKRWFSKTRTRYLFFPSELVDYFSSKMFLMETQCTSSKMEMNTIFYNLSKIVFFRTQSLEMNTIIRYLLCLRKHKPLKTLKQE